MQGGVPAMVPQVVPSETCVRCEVCCRFPHVDSPLRPFFTTSEISTAVAHGVSPDVFVDDRGCQVNLVPDADDEGYLCPAFDADTARCGIYGVRPLDCRLYPFALMWDCEHRMVLLGWDPKCPFLLQQTGAGDAYHEVEDLAAIPALPTHIRDDGRRLARQLEDGALGRAVCDDPRVITPFQEDVIVLHELPGLSRTVSPS